MVNARVVTIQLNKKFETSTLLTNIRVSISTSTAQLFIRKVNNLAFVILEGLSREQFATLTFHNEPLSLINCDATGIQLCKQVVRGLGTCVYGRLMRR
jgi:hypothetical protein